MEQGLHDAVKPCVLVSLSACLHQLESFIISPPAHGSRPHNPQPWSYRHQGPYLSRAPDITLPFFLPSITYLNLRNISAASNLQGVLEGCPSLQSASFTVSSTSVDVTHGSLRVLFIESDLRRNAWLTLNAPCLRTLDACWFASIRGTVSGEMRSLSIFDSCQSLALSPVPSQLRHFTLQGTYTQPLLAGAVGIINASCQTLTTVELMPTCRPSLVQTDTLDEYPLLPPSTLKQAWSAILGCSSLSVLTLDVSLVLQPSMDCMLMRNLSHLSLIVWDCKEFLSHDAPYTHDSFEKLTWRRLTEQLVAGCPRLSAVELSMSENVPPACLTALYTGQARFKGVNVSYRAYTSRYCSA